MKYTILNNTKTINIDDKLIKLYESHVAPFNQNRVEYLAASCGLTESDSIDNIEKSIIEAIYDEIDTFNHLNTITAQAVIKGLVK